MTKAKTKRLLEKAMKQTKELEDTLRVVDLTIGTLDTSLTDDVVALHARLTSLLKLKVQKEAV